MTHIQSAGYIVHDGNDTIQGCGATVEAAWSDMQSTLKSAHIAILGDDDDTSDLDGSWVLGSGLKTIPASAGLLAMVESAGGSCTWDTVNGVACTRDERDYQS